MTTLQEARESKDQAVEKAIIRLRRFPGISGERLLVAVGWPVSSGEVVLQRLAKHCHWEHGKPSEDLKNELFYLTAEQRPQPPSFEPYVGGKVDISYCTPTWNKGRAERAEAERKQRVTDERAAAAALESQQHAKIKLTVSKDGQPKPKIDGRKTGLSRQTAITRRSEQKFIDTLESLQSTGDPFSVKDFLARSGLALTTYYSKKYEHLRLQVAAAAKASSQTILRRQYDNRDGAEPVLVSVADKLTEAIDYFEAKGTPFTRAQVEARAAVGSNTFSRGRHNEQYERLFAVRDRLAGDNPTLPKRVRVFRTFEETETIVRTAIIELIAEKKPFSLRSISARSGITLSTLANPIYSNLRAEMAKARDQSGWKAKLSEIRAEQARKAQFGKKK